MSEHLFIPDTQIKAGVPTDHVVAAAKYARDKKPDTIVIAGDWWDMPSLSSYEKKGSKYFEGRRYVDDVEAGNNAMADFLRELHRSRGYRPRIVFTMGNHEYRIERAANENPVLEAKIGFHDLYLPEKHIEVVPFLRPIEIDGVLYCHYFQNPQSLMRSVLGGTIDNRLNKVKQSFTMGHQQTLLWGCQYTTGGRRIIGCVAGAFYQHEEEYQGPQGNNYWRGCVFKHEVRQGEYDPMMLSIDYLRREWL